MAGYGNFIPSQFHQEKSSLEAAAEAAAKVNAMLIAKGKLRPNQIHNNSQNQKKVNPNNMVAAEVEINDAPLSMRNMLTRGPTQEEITKFSGAAVSTRGRYMPPVEKMKNTSSGAAVSTRMGYMTPGDKMKNASSERPLYLFVQGPTQDSVNVAVARINEILTGGKGAGATGGGLVRTGGPPVPQHQLTMPPPHQPPPQNPAQAMLPVPTLEMPPVHQPPPMLAAPVQPPPEMQQITVLEEKLFIGLEHAPPNFDVKGKLLGPGGSYLMHIDSETGAKVMLRGKGSGFIDPALGREPFEPMHIIIQHPSVLGMQQAKQLAENLIQTVQQMYASFQQALAALPPPVAPGPTAYISGLQQPTSLAEAALMGPPPGLPTITALPDAQLVPSAPALQPQQAMIVPSSSMSSVMMPAGSLASSLPAINPGQPGAPSMLLNTTLSMAPVPVVTTLPISSQTPLQLQPPPTALELGQQQLIMSQAPPPQPLQMTLAPQMSVQTSMPASMASLASLPTQLAPAPGPHGLNPAALQPPGVQLVSQPAPVAPPPMLAAPPAPVSGPAQPQPFQAMYTPEVVSSGPMLTPGLTSLVVSTTPSSHIYSLATSSSMVSHTLGPSKDAADPARRRFTEDKDDKIPDSLLGYQHGPPHLVNLVCSSPPPGSQNQPGLHPNPPTLIPGQTPGQAAFQPGPQPGMPPHHPQLAAAPQPQPMAMLPAQPGLPPQPQPGVPAGQIELQPAHPGLPAAMAPGHPANPASFAMPQAFQVQTIHTLPAQLPPPPNSLSPVSQAYHVPPSSMPDDNRFGVPVSSSAGGMMPPPPPPGAMGMSPSSSGEQSNGPRQLMPPPARHDGQPWGGPAHGVKRGMSNEEGGEQDRKRRKENGFEEDDGSSQSPSAQSESPKPGTPTLGHVPRSQNHSPVREGPPQDSFEQQPPHPPPPPPPPHHPQGVFQQQQAPPQFEPGMALPPQQILHPGPHLNGSHQAPPFDPAGQPPPPPLHQQFVEPGTQPPPPPLQFQEIGQQFAPPPNSQGELGPFHHPQGPPQGQGEMPHPFPPPGHAGGPPGELGHPFAHGVPAASQGELGHTVSSQPPSHAPYPLSQSFSQPGPQAHFINTLPVSSANTFLPAPHFIPQHAPGTRHHPHPHGPPPPPPPPPPTSQYQHGPPQGYWHS